MAGRQVSRWQVQQMAGWAETADGRFKVADTDGRQRRRRHGRFAEDLSGDIHPGIPQDRLYNLTIKIDNTLHLIKVLQHSSEQGNHWSSYSGYRSVPYRIQTPEQQSRRVARYYAVWILLNTE
jgi:hypothetical protein